MNEDRTQNYVAEIYEDFIHDIPFSEREREFTFAICHRPSVSLSSVVYL